MCRAVGSLVIDLQRDALDPKVRVSDLLRRAFVVAKKLNLAEFEAWVTHELHGYPVGTECPKYRVFEGQPRVWNPYHGWQPVVFASTKQQTSFCRMPTRQPVAEIEALVAQAAQSGGGLTSNFPPEVARQLMELSGAPGAPVLHIDSSTLVGVLDAVRSALLKWSLRLQEDGIRGDETGFSDEEKAVAVAAPYTVNNFFAPISGSQLQIASHGAEQTNHTSFDLEALRGFLVDLEKLKGDLQLDDCTSQELESDLRTLHSQLASPKPKLTIIREGLSSLRSILESGAGGALGNAATTLLPKLLALLP